jgi:hypothetical protein
VAKFKYFGTTITNTNFIHEDIASRLNSRDASYHSAQTLLSSLPLHKNFSIKLHKTIILPVATCGYEGWSFTLREKLRLRVFENRVPKRIFGSRREETNEDDMGEVCSTNGNDNKLIQNFGWNI